MHSSDYLTGTVHVFVYIAGNCEGTLLPGVDF